VKKRILSILKWTLLTAYIIAMLGFAAKEKKNLICSEIIIDVDYNHKFIDKDTVDNMLITNDINIDSCIVDKLNFGEIEKIIESDPYIKQADVYSNFSGQVFITLKQRNPVMRIITKNNDHYYVDDECKLMPVCSHYSANVIVVSGEISEDFFNPGFKPQILNDSITGDVNLPELFNFVKYINEHELWQAQIEQIYINENMEVELIPRVGNHIIILGNLENYKYKLGKLEALYKKGFALTDWNIYSTINLKYSDQVICKKR
jgi:cell division protein FtsQ